MAFPPAVSPPAEKGRPTVATTLLAISGPLRKSEFVLGSALTIGRDAGNHICIEDPAVSPHHCKIEFQDSRPVLLDLDSHSGTFVNGIPVRQRELKSGDEIAIADSVFLFAAGESRSAPSSPLEMSEPEALDVKALEFPSNELLSLDPDSLAALPQSERMVRNLNALLQICRAIGSLRDEELQPWVLLGMIFDVIPAERGAILLLEEDSHEVRSQVAWDRVFGPEHPVHIDGGIVRRVIEERISLLDSGVPKQQSVNSSGKQEKNGNDRKSPRRALLCVPMISKDKPIGLIYLESSSPTTMFTESDFQLLTAIAGLGVVGIENARQLERLGSENQRLRAAVSLTHDMVGSSARMREVYQFIERVAPSDSTVLIHGESGTGKELAACAIHKNSPRKNQPFVALNCAALTETLLESELFGHEKGAFTSAFSQKKGFLEVAEGGTIFLDEIGELSLILQAKLLRVLQEREFVRVGGTRPIKINVRFLAATNKDLQKCVREEKFRADLYHRLNVIAITIPALRDHPEDIPALAEHFSVRHARNCNRNVVGISDEALACLTQYDWPGNIRELENAMERAVVIGSSERISAEDLPETVLDTAKSAGAAPANYHDAVRNLKKQLILNALDQGAGNVTEAAKILGVHANYLHRLMRNFALRPAMRKQTGM
jgi:transcriptional regulator with GAF, ATPase, and Fis domain/pSer/pThr/pTyr-binding forkhead associated (FHA) protein